MAKNAVLLTVTLKYTLFPLNHPYFLKYSFLRKMQTQFCTGTDMILGFG